MNLVAILMRSSIYRRLHDPVVVHFLLTIFWAINLVAVWFIPPSWRILYIVVVSIYANLVGHWSAYEAARAKREIVEVQESPSGL